jgi:hypothetical protein
MEKKLLKAGLFIGVIALAFYFGKKFEQVKIIGSFDPSKTIYIRSDDGTFILAKS